MLKIGDKIKYVKANPFIEFPIETVLEVTDIKGTTLAVKGEYKANDMVVGYIEGLMSYNEYEKCFEKVVEEAKVEPKKNPWTEWKEITPEVYDKMCRTFEDCPVCPLRCICNNYGELNMEYKTNNKKLMVRYKMPNGEIIKAHSTCNKVDTFDLNTGLEVALARLNVKVAEKNFKSFIETV